jgi:hypothetical protein
MAYGRCFLSFMCALFVLAANSSEGTVLVHDNFNRPDGGLDGQEPTPGPFSEAWNAGSNTGVNPLQVVNGAAVIRQIEGPNSEDVAINFGDQPATATTYARFDFMLPSADNADLAPNEGTGDPGVGLEGLYFVTLREQSASMTLRARMGVLAPLGAGDFRLGINADNGNLSLGAIWAEELYFDTSYRAVITYNSAMNSSTLWVDPLDENSTSVTHTNNSVAGIVIDRFSLRQHTTYNGKQILDNLVIATTFSEALNPPPIMVGLPGDYNGDMVVDAADYTVWRNNLNTDFDLNGNGDETGSSAGVVDEADYAYWRANYGSAGSGGGGVSSIAAPEPSSAISLLFAIAIAIGSGRSCCQLTLSSTAT